MENAEVLALDIGGTKMAAAIVASDTTICGRASCPTPAGADAEELFETAVLVAEAALSDDGGAPKAIGVGCGGPMLWPSGDVSPLNIPGWRDFPLRDRLANRFGLPVRVHNDAICLTIGEHLAGAGRGHHNVLGMVVSTGVGGGLILHDELVDGVSGNAGHVGHIVVDPDGPSCACGGNGCLEAIARGPALVAWAQEQGWRGEPTGEALAESARAGDIVATRAFARAGAAVGTAVASAVALTDVEIVSIGGGVSHAGDLVLDSLFEAFERHAGLDFVRRCRIVLAGPDAGLVGAAGLFLAGDLYWHGDAERPGSDAPSTFSGISEYGMNPSS